MIGEPREELLIPQAAIRHDGNQAYVLVVGANNTIEWRAVTGGPVTAGRQVVRAGIGLDDRIIIDGIGGVTPGAPIRVRETDPPK
jgi:multidrug efflux system membrane fusion protein